MSKPDKPTMLWDGECHFCRRWIERWQRMTRGHVQFRTYQEALPEFPQVSEDACRKAVQLITTDGRVYSAAHAVFKSLAEGGRYPWLLKWYESSRIFKRISEFFYRFTARNRSWLPGI